MSKFGDYLKAIHVDTLNPLSREIHLIECALMSAARIGDTQIRWLVGSYGFDQEKYDGFCKRIIKHFLDNEMDVKVIKCDNKTLPKLLGLQITRSL